MGRLLLITVLALSTVACGPRGPGPSQGDFGQVTYWKVASSTLQKGACTDDPNGPVKLKAPEFPENSYLVYKLAKDGKTAVTQDCTTTSASSCTDSKTGIVFDVLGHELTWRPKADVKSLTGTTCQLSAEQTWTVDDQGETAALTVPITFDLVTDQTACDALEAQIKAGSPNKLGLRGCVYTLALGLTFKH